MQRSKTLHAAVFALLIALMPGIVRAWPVSSGLPMPPAESSAKPADQAYAKGLTALNANDLAAAETAFKSALSADPSSLGAVLGLADVAIRRGQIEEVKNWLERARTIKPNSAVVESAWGRYYYARREYDKAEVQLKKAREMDPNVFLPWIDLAELYLNQLGKPKQAVEAFREAIRIRPDHAGAQFGLGMALAAVGDNAKALPALQQAARLEPNNALPWLGIGQVQAAQRRFEQAVEAYSHGIKVQPDFAQLYVGRGNAYSGIGDDPKAVVDYDKALALQPKTTEAHVRKAMIYQRWNKPDDAQAGYLAALAIDPKYALAYNNLAWMAAERKARLDDALTWARRATELVPSQSQFFDTLGWVHRARGELDQAATALEKAIVLAPKDAEAHYHLGVVYSEQNQKQRAVTALKKALSLDPKFPAAADTKKRLSALGG